MLSGAFQVRRSGTDITEAHARTGIETGITLGVEFVGLIPPYEEYAAMVGAHYNEKEWGQLEPEKRARAVAYYRLNRLVALHESDAVALKAHQNQRG